MSDLSKDFKEVSDGINMLLERFDMLRKAAREVVQDFREDGTIYHDVIDKLATCAGVE